MIASSQFRSADWYEAQAASATCPLLRCTRMRAIGFSKYVRASLICALSAFAFASAALYSASASFHRKSADLSIACRRSTSLCVSHPPKPEMAKHKAQRPTTAGSSFTQSIWSSLPHGTKSQCLQNTRHKQTSRTCFLTFFGWWWCRYTLRFTIDRSGWRCPACRLVPTGAIAYRWTASP